MIDATEVTKEATARYNSDQFFRHLVDAAALLVVPKTVNESVNKALMTAATEAASVVLILEEQMREAGTNEG